MQKQEKSFLGYIIILLVGVVLGVATQYVYKPIPQPMQIIEVPVLVDNPTVKIVEVPKECPEAEEKQKRWFE